eukprot:1150862-Pelagomonas_calceolata.AAC.9
MRHPLLLTVPYLAELEQTTESMTSLALFSLCTGERARDAAASDATRRQQCSFEAGLLPESAPRFLWGYERVQLSRGCLSRQPATGYKWQEAILQRLHCKLQRFWPKALSWCIEIRSDKNGWALIDKATEMADLFQFGLHAWNGVDPDQPWGGTGEQ